MQLASRRDFRSYCSLACFNRFVFKSFVQLFGSSSSKESTHQHVVLHFADCPGNWDSCSLSGMMFMFDLMVQIIYNSMRNSKNSKLFLVPLLIVFGAVNTILLSFQGVQKDGDGNIFFHPFIQCLLMFIGEFVTIFYYLIKEKYLDKKKFLMKQEFMKEKAKWYLPILPAILDVFSSTLAYIALTFSPGEVWQMSRGGVIITTALFSRIFLKTKFTRSIIFGCIITFIGITLVQLFDILFNHKQSGSSIPTELKILGIVLLILSLFFNSSQLISEKWIFEKYSMSPVKMVFLEGLYGIIVMTGIIAIVSQIHCPWSDIDSKHCVRVNDQYYLESFPVFWSQIREKWAILVLCLGLIVSIGISVPIGVSVTKYISPIARCLADTARTVLIWLFGIILSLTSKQYSDFTNTDGLLNGLKAVGFFIMIIGVLIYYEIIKLYKNERDEAESLLETESLETTSAKLEQSS